MWVAFVTTLFRKLRSSRNLQHRVPSLTPTTTVRTHNRCVPPISNPQPPTAVAATETPQQQGSPTLDPPTEEECNAVKEPEQQSLEHHEPCTQPQQQHSSPQPLMEPELHSQPEQHSLQPTELDCPQPDQFSQHSPDPDAFQWQHPQPANDSALPPTPPAPVTGGAAVRATPVRGDTPSGISAPRKRKRKQFHKSGTLTALSA